MGHSQSTGCNYGNRIATVQQQQTMSNGSIYSTEAVNKEEEEETVAYSGKYCAETEAPVAVHVAKTNSTTAFFCGR